MQTLTKSNAKNPIFTLESKPYKQDSSKTVKFTAKNMKLGQNERLSKSQIENSNIDLVKILQSQLLSKP